MADQEFFKSCYNGICAGMLSVSDGKSGIEWSGVRTTAAIVGGIAALFFVTAGACGLYNPNAMHAAFNFKGYHFFATQTHCAFLIVTGLFISTITHEALRATQTADIIKLASYT